MPYLLGPKAARGRNDVNRRSRSPSSGRLLLGLIAALFACGPSDAPDQGETVRGDEARGVPAESTESRDLSSQRLGTASATSDEERRRPPSPEPPPAPPAPEETAAHKALQGAAVGGETGATISGLMDEESARLTEELKGDSIVRIAEGIHVLLTFGVQFDDGSDRLTPEAIDRLSRLASRLSEFGDANALIVAHAVDGGSDQENLRLSERRGLAAVELLVEQGIDRGRLVYVGRGSMEVAAAPSSEDARTPPILHLEVAIFAGPKLRGGGDRGRKAF